MPKYRFVRSNLLKGIRKGGVFIEFTENQKRQLEAELIAEDFTNFLNTFHSYQQPYDTELDHYIYSSYAKGLEKEMKGQGVKMNWRKPYFSPSGANKCPRELYVKMQKANKDEEEIHPIQRRWQVQGTLVGDLIQREVLLAERHYHKFTGKYPRFKFKRTEEGYPAFEDFIKTQKDFGNFTLLGTSDGLMDYLSDSGEAISVGLEIKSSQTSYNALAQKKEAKEDHILQCVCYSLMYDIDYFLIAYISTAKKSWNYTPEEFKKYPDIKIFGVYVTEQMKQDILERFQSIVDSFNEMVPPKLDITKFTFNNFKEATAKSLTNKEVEELRTQVDRYKKSKVPAFVKNSVVAALEKIEELRS